MDWWGYLVITIYSKTPAPSNLGFFENSWDGPRFISDGIRGKAKLEQDKALNTNHLQVDFLSTFFRTDGENVVNTQCTHPQREQENKIQKEQGLWEDL